MKIAFLILAHKNPKQLSKLIQSLNNPNTGIFLHLDKRCNLSEFKNSFNQNNISVDYISQSQKIIYSSITYIYATLDILNEAYNCGFDYFILISGQDFPIKNIEEIVSIIEKNREANYIDHKPFPVEELNYKGDTRIRYFNYNVLGKMETHFPWKEIKHKMSFKGKILNLFLWFRSFRATRRVFPYYMKPYYSSQWWNMSREAIAYILKFIEDNPKYLKFHKRALHPEEMFFQSILLNNKSFQNKIENDNLRYIRWVKGNKHPEIIDEKDIRSFNESNAIFARKFNDLKLINRYLLPID